MKAVDLRESVLGHPHLLVAPVDLSLRAGQHLLALVQGWLRRSRPGAAEAGRALGAVFYLASASGATAGTITWWPIQVT